MSFDGFLMSASLVSLALAFLYGRDDLAAVGLITAALALIFQQIRHWREIQSMRMDEDLEHWDRGL